MGVCISLIRGDDIHNPVDEWNGLGGNKALFRALSDLPTEHHPTLDPIDFYVLRPAVFTPWRQHVAAGSNVDTFNAILDRLESDDELWLEFSY